MEPDDVSLRSLLEDLEQVASELAREQDGARIVFSKPIHNADFGVSCLLLDVPLDRVDLLELTVSARDGRLAADVVWGHPSGHVECSWTEYPQVLSNENVSWLREDLPRLVRGLRRALARGKPPG